MFVVVPGLLGTLLVALETWSQVFWGQPFRSQWLVSTTNCPSSTCWLVLCRLTLMKEGVVGKIVGVDISVPAIEDAKANAQLNGFGATTLVGDKQHDNTTTTDADNGQDDMLQTTRFVAARAEHALYRELKMQGSNRYDKVIAVVDPAREGLHADVLKSIRCHSQIDRLVYVSCNPTGSLIKDAALLCTPASKRYRGRPFKPTFAQPVDMFPYSNHCELVMVFDRLTDTELSEEDRQNEKKDE